MKQLFLLASLLLLMSVPLCGQTPNSAKPESVTQASEQELRKADDEYRTARLNRDVPALKRLLAEEFLSISNSGQIIDKTAGLEIMAKSSTGELQYDEVKIRIYGNTAIVTGRQTNEENQQARFTRVWVKKPDQWQLVSAHISHMPA
jgi:hypothetical protein